MRRAAAVALAAIAAGCSPEGGPAGPARGAGGAGPPGGEFRVALLVAAQEAVVAVGGRYQIAQRPAPGRPAARVESGDRLPATRFRYASGRFEADAGDAPRALGPGPLAISPDTEGTILLPPRRYRGRLVLYGNPDGTIDAVNEVGLEAYVAGVVGAEMPASFPEEALAAQAVAARTYAVYHLRAGKAGRRWIGTADQNFQVYRGVEAEAARVLRAVERTRGLILVWQGQVFPAYYHSTCGGRTRDAAEAFGQRSIPPLAGSECGACGGAPHFRWTARLPRTEVAERLGLARLDRIGMAASSRGPSRVRVAGPEGETLLTRDEVRSRLGTRAVRSPDFELKDEGDRIVFEGRGFGHGVGLCQEGAAGFAARGWGFAEILDRYYPGAATLRIR